MAITQQPQKAPSPPPPQQQQKQQVLPPRPPPQQRQVLPPPQQRQVLPPPQQRQVLPPPQQRQVLPPPPPPPPQQQQQVLPPRPPPPQQQQVLPPRPPPPQQQQQVLPPPPPQQQQQQQQQQQAPRRRRRRRRQYFYIILPQSTPALVPLLNTIDYRFQIVLMQQVEIVRTTTSTTPYLTSSPATCSSTVATSCNTTTSIVASCQSYEVSWNNHCYYLDGSGGNCTIGYSRATNAILGCIATQFVTKTYRSKISDSCCVWAADTYECYGLTDDNCNNAGPFTAGPVFGGGRGCINTQQRLPAQLTFCGSN
ncbi:unnamed protein product [Rotaria socialis]